MDYVETLFNESKLLARAMDAPMLTNGTNGPEFDCTTWANEFVLLLNRSLSSVSTTLLVPDIGIPTYKNMGFLIDSDMSICLHASKTDSMSSGNVQDGDFEANGPSLPSISELATSIKETNSKEMNEVNVEASIGSVAGLFINKCRIQEELLKMMLVVKRCVSNIAGIDYPIYLYDSKEGKLSKISLSLDEEKELIDSIEPKQIFYWPEGYDSPVSDSLSELKL